MSSPTQRSLALLRKQGYIAQVVEKYNAFSGKKNDLFGCIDILAVKAGEILGVQTTSADNVSARVRKSLSEPRLKVWFEAGGLFVVHGWGLRGKRGERKLWRARIVELTLNDLPKTSGAST
jgi:hypothetical protein